MSEMHFAFLFLRFSFSRAKISEFPDLNVEYSGNEEFDPNEAISPSSQYAFVTSITGDDNMEHEVLKCAMIAYTMWLSNPKYDRVLLISTNFKMSEAHETRLARLYTHVYFSPHVQFPCNKNLSKASDRHFWFKLNALTVLGYDKLLWVGHDIFIVKDVTPLFEYPVPAAPPDYQLWDFSEYGPVHNFDFFVFKPSLDDFRNLRKRGCDWIEHPGISERRKKMEDPPFIGAYDNGLFEDYFKDEITTLPKYACFEVPGIKEGVDSIRGDETDPRIIAYRFSNGNMPWDNPGYVVSEAWTYTLKKMFEALEENPSFADKSILPTSSNRSYEAVSKRPPQPKNLTESEIRETFIEFALTPKSRIIINGVGIFLGSVAVLIFDLLNTLTVKVEKKETQKTV